MSAGDAEHVGEVGVTRSRRQEVVGPHDLFDTLRVVIDDHDKVVGGGAVAASSTTSSTTSVLAVQTIDDGHRWLFGPQADGRRFARRLPLGDLCRREITTCAGVVAGRQVGCRHRLTDLSASTSTVGQPGVLRSVARPRSVPSARTAGPVRRPNQGRDVRDLDAVRPRARVERSPYRDPRTAAGTRPGAAGEQPAASAVRRFPMWRTPVGLGAKRPRLTRRVSRGPQPTGRTGPV